MKQKWFIALSVALGVIMTSILGYLVYLTWFVFDVLKGMGL